VGGLSNLDESQDDVGNIEQTATRRQRKPDSVLIGCKSLPKDLEIEMEDPRCRIAAVEIDDTRCKSLIQGVVIEAEDLRCKSLGYRVTTEMEDPRCVSVAMKMDDPRCQSLCNW